MPRAITGRELFSPARTISRQLSLKPQVRKSHETQMATWQHSTKTVTRESRCPHSIFYRSPEVLSVQCCSLEGNSARITHGTRPPWSLFFTHPHPGPPRRAVLPVGQTHLPLTGGPTRVGFFLPMQRAVREERRPPNPRFLLLPGSTSGGGPARLSRGGALPNIGGHNEDHQEPWCFA